MPTAFNPQELQMQLLLFFFFFFTTCCGKWGNGLSLEVRLTQTRSYILLYPKKALKKLKMCFYPLKKLELSCLNDFNYQAYF